MNGQPVPLNPTQKLDQVLHPIVHLCYPVLETGFPVQFYILGMWKIL